MVTYKEPSDSSMGLLSDVQFCLKLLSTNKFQSLSPGYVVTDFQLKMHPNLWSGVRPPTHLSFGSLTLWFKESLSFNIQLY